MLSIIFTISILTNMMLPYRLLSIELTRNDCLNTFLHYQKSLKKIEKNSQRVNFLTSCFKAVIILRFLNSGSRITELLTRNQYLSFRKVCYAKNCIDPRNIRKFEAPKWRKRDERFRAMFQKHYYHRWHSIPDKVHERLVKQ